MLDFTYSRQDTHGVYDADGIALPTGHAISGAYRYTLTPEVGGYSLAVFSYGAQCVHAKRHRGDWPMALANAILDAERFRTVLHCEGE